MRNPSSPRAMLGIAPSQQPSRAGIHDGAVINEEQKHSDLSDLAGDFDYDFAEIDDEFAEAQPLRESSGRLTSGANVEVGKREYDQRCEEASKKRSRFYNGRNVKAPGSEVSVVIFGAGYISRGLDKKGEGALVLYAEETAHGSTELVFIDLEGIPPYTEGGQRMLVQLRKLFHAARSAQEPSYGFRYGNVGFIYQASQFFDSLGSNEFERPLLYDLKAATKLKVSIMRANAGMPVSRELLPQVNALIRRLGLESATLLRGAYSKEGIFNTSTDPKLSLPGKLVLCKVQGLTLRMQHYNPSLLFAHQVIYSAAGNDKASDKFRGHPLAKLASLLNQLFGLTVVPNLNMMAQLVALALDVKLEEFSKKHHKSALRNRLANNLDTSLRHVVFALNFRFLQFVKVPEFQETDASEFLKVLAYWLRSDDGRLGALHADDKEHEEALAADVATLDRAFKASWDDCVLVLELVLADEEQIKDAAGADVLVPRTREVLYQVVKIHTRAVNGKQMRDAYFPSTKQSNKAALGTCSLKDTGLAVAIQRTYDELLTWDQKTPRDEVKHVHLNAYKVNWDGKAGQEPGHEDELTQEERVRREAAMAVYWSHTKFNENYRGDEMSIDEIRLTAAETRTRLQYGLTSLEKGGNGLLANSDAPHDGSAGTPPEQRLPVPIIAKMADPTWPWRVVSSRTRVTKYSSAGAPARTSSPRTSARRCAASTWASSIRWSTKPGRSSRSRTSSKVTASASPHL